MSQANAHQLRLVRDAVERLDGEAATCETIRVLLSELIAKERLDLPRTSIAQEAAYQRALDDAVVQERSAQTREDAGEGISIPALESFLRGAFVDETDLRVESAATVSRGMSKKTVLVHLGGNRRLPSKLALRADRSSNNYLGTTVLDEWGPLQLLWKHGARIPQPFALESTGAVIGDPFIVFAAVEGAPGGSIYAPPAGKPALLADIAACMAGVHAVPTDEWPSPSQPQGDAYFDAQLASHQADWQALGEANPIMDACFDWIIRNRHLAEGRPAITHDDFNVNNLMISGQRVSAVLDWEFAHVGTPAADIAYLWYTAESLDSFAAFLSAYEAAGGTPPPQDQLNFYRVWGQLRLGVMGHKAVRALECGNFDDVRFGISRWQRRQGLLRLAGLLEELGIR